MSHACRHECGEERRETDLSYDPRDILEVSSVGDEEGEGEE